MRPALLFPAWIFLFILPFTHTVALRQLSLFAAFAIAAWLWWSTREPRLAQVPAWRWIVFWAVLPLALLPLSLDPRYSLGEIKTEMLYGAMAFLAFFVLVRSEQALRDALRALIAGYAVLTAWAIGSRLYTGTWIEASYFGGVGTFSTYLVTAIPMLIVTWRLRVLGPATPWLVALLLALGLGAGMFTEQRSFWFAFGIQAAALLWLLRMARLWRPPAGLFWGLLAAVLALSLGLMIEAISRRFGSGADLASMLAQDPRVRNWGEVIEWITARPQGYGFGRGMMAKAFPGMWGRDDMFWHAHNVVLNQGFQLGLAGMAAILGVFVALSAHWLRLVRGSDEALKAIGIAGVLMAIGVLARNFTNDFFQRDLALLFWALNGTLAGYAERGPMRGSAR